ncbi:MAG: hypothetical protein AB8G95_19675 [Anaerolineae bacterium]
MNMQKLRSHLLRFAFTTERKTWLQISQKHWIQTLLIAFLVFGLIRQAWWLVISCVTIFFMLNLLYRWGKRGGYTTFVETEPPQESWTGEALSDTNKLPLRATGHFLVGKTERRLILVSGECWQLPIGEIALMLEAAPSHFAYQFIGLDAIEQARFGKIWFGNSYEIAIEVVFQTDWIQVDNQIKMGWQKWSDTDATMGQRVVILSFNTLDDARQVWDKVS